MPKYRLLTDQELSELEKEFIEYLVLNGIAADDWQRLKVEENAHAQQIVDLFSDVVMEGALRKIMFLEHRSSNHLRTFHCLPKKIVLVGLSAEKADGVDFTNAEFLKEATRNPPKSMKIYTSEKKYAPSREEELFRMTQQGCFVADGKLYKTLSLLLAKHN